MAKIKLAKQMFEQITALADSMKQAFSDDEPVAVEMVRSSLADGTIIDYENLEVGSVVNIVTTEGEGEDEQEVLTVAPDGEHTLEDGRILVITDGVVSEVRDAEPQTEDEEFEMSEEMIQAILLASNFNMDELTKLVNMKEDGYHTVEFGVSSGKISWGEVRSNTYKALMSEQTNPLEEEIVQLRAEIETLKKEPVGKAPKAVPTKMSTNKPLTKIQRKKMELKRARNK